MELRTSTMIGASLLLLLSLLRHRGLSQPTKAFCLFVVLSFGLPSFGFCSLDGIQVSAENDGCGSGKQNYNNMVLNGPFLGGIDLGSKNLVADRRVENVCSNSDYFCFPSTLPGFPFKEHEQEATGSEYSGSESDGIRLGGSFQSTRQASNSSWSLDHGMFGLLNGKTLSCSLNFRESSDELSSIRGNSADQYDLSSCRGPLVNQKSLRLNESDMMKSTSYDGSSSPHLEISAPALDWGQKYLYFPSVAFLTVTNTDSDSNLHVYEPFSTDIQFYPCNFSEVLLRPGEEAAFCFVFLPIWLGSSSAQLVLQTSFGGFLIQAKGFAMESPYGIQPLFGLDETTSGRWIKNLSLFNPYDEMLYVKEVTAWISVSSGNNSHYLEATCSVKDLQDSDELSPPSVKNGLIVNSGQGGWPLLTMRPHRGWEIDPRGSENILELDFSAGSGGKTFGVFCMQLLRSSKSQPETIMVPLGGQVNGKATYDDLIHPTAISIERLVPFYVNGIVAIAISLRNNAPYLLNVIEITQVADAKVFHIKYMEGLLLYPGTSTEAGIVACSHLPVELLDSPPVIFNVYMDCKLQILTNDSSTPQIEIPCQDMINICTMHQRHSSVGYEHQSGNIESGSSRTSPFKSNLQLSSQVKVLEATEADEWVLANWKSQGTSSDMSVLQHREVLFPMIQVGNHCSMWITVKNPSLQPIVMQLILNSGEIVDECRDPDGFVQPPSSGAFEKGSVKPTKYGFSIAMNALTEAYVQPHGRVSFGPILFHPSSRCRWRSSTLVRNNLSGVEWLSLRGYGGSLSLVLFEGPEPVQQVDFDLSSLVPVNLSSLGTLVHKEDAFPACSQSLSKELYAKNTGDLPLEVRRIEVSGTQCSMDGFIVHTCKGFALEPGESFKFLISYQTDFSAVMVHRDLELSLATGMLVIPMKASLPAYLLNLCKKSTFWARMKKVFLVVLLAVFLMVLVLCCIFPQVTALGSHVSLCKSEESSVHLVSSEPKSSPVYCNMKTNKLSVSSKMDDLCKSVKDRTSVPGSLRGCHEGQGWLMEPGKTPQYVQLSLVNQSRTDNLSNTPKTKASSLLSNSGTGEHFDTVESSKPGDLTVRIGKEKGRRRRKRKGAVSGLTGSFEVSSSHSGNSTPSSPLSPVSSTTPKQTWPLSPDVDRSHVLQNPFVKVATLQTETDRVVEHALSKENKLKLEVPAKHCSKNLLSNSQEQPPAPSKMANKPVLLPSATFPCAGRSASSMLGSPSSASTFRIAPHVQAPGSKLNNQKTLNPGEEAGLRDEFRYDIWGNCFSGIQLKDGSIDLSPMISSAKESESESFFVRGPQALITAPQPRSVSFRKVG